MNLDCPVHDATPPVYVGLSNGHQCICYDSRGNVKTPREAAQLMTLLVELFTGKHHLHSGWCVECWSQGHQREAQFIPVF